MLTVKQIDAAKPKDKPYRLLDANGLYLYVPASGKKVWQLRYKLAGKEKVMTVGKYPFMSLQEARDKSFLARKEVNDGIDPIQASKKKNESQADSFGEIFNEWHANKTKVWSHKYADEMKRMFDDDILPIIGHMRMEEVEPMVVLKVIRLFEDRGAMERADKARRRCGEVFRYAIITGRAKYNPAPDLVDALKGYRKQNFPFLPMEKIPAFNKALLGYGGSIIAKVATQVLQYTALRTIELRSMAWENIDYENRLISIDPGVMKGRREHIVPMSDQVIALLRFLQPITGMHRLVFVGRNDQTKSLSENAILGVIRRIGYESQTCGHGFRHQFSTVLNEHHWNKDAIEMQLAHVSGTGTRGVYNHAAYIKTRREMMQCWADWIDAEVMH